MTVQDTSEIMEVKPFSLEQIPLDHLSHDYSRQVQDYLSGSTTIA